MSTRARKSGGRVSFVGTGTGDAGLLTVRAAEVLAGADIAFVDDSVSERGGPREFLVGVQLGEIAGQARERHDVRFRDGASGRPDHESDVEIVEEAAHVSTP